MRTKRLIGVESGYSNVSEFVKHDLDLPDDVRRGVVVSLPLIAEIEDAALRNKVIDAWALALCENGYGAVEELPGSGMPGAPEVGDQTHHLLGVTRIALGIKDSLEKTLDEPLGVSRDVVLAAALCHDLGKPFEYAPENRRRWDTNPGAYGRPSLRHPTYGAHIAMVVDMPEEVVNTCGYHSPEGRFIDRSLAATIVHYADDAYWFTLEVAKNWETKVPRL
ncbi:HD domain-containing protein [Ruania zhangjianzhongii]|uniref:HD domain-containing protein n=1 Tax=Ruania zhangjianzhongii TaxID=2603206 RepID=UPI00143CD8C6|nr:HD domain-containing protein [Ruania zhangjianzhongii]